MANLVECILTECNRIRDSVLPAYDDFPAGAIAAAMMRTSIKRAEAAIASGDAADCVAALLDLRGYTL